MLTLTRRTGETIYLGEDISVTVYERLRYHLLIAVIAPVHTRVRLGDARVRPVQLPGGEQFHLLTLLDHEEFQIDTCRLRFRFTPTVLAAGRNAKRQVKVDIDAPDWLDIVREEVALRQSQDVGRRQAMMRVSRWLHRANAVVANALMA